MLASVVVLICVVSLCMRLLRSTATGKSGSDPAETKSGDAIRGSWNREQLLGQVQLGEEPVHLEVLRVGLLLLPAHQLLHLQHLVLVPFRLLQQLLDELLLLLLLLMLLFDLEAQVVEHRAVDVKPIRMLVMLLILVVGSVAQDAQVVLLSRLLLLKRVFVLEHVVAQAVDFTLEQLQGGLQLLELLHVRARHGAESRGKSAEWVHGVVLEVVLKSA